MQKYYNCYLLILFNPLFARGLFRFFLWIWIGVHVTPNFVGIIILRFSVRGDSTPTFNVNTIFLIMCYRLLTKFYLPVIPFRLMLILVRIVILIFGRFIFIITPFFRLSFDTSKISIWFRFSIGIFKIAGICGFVLQKLNQTCCNSISQFLKLNRYK